MVFLIPVILLTISYIIGSLPMKFFATKEDGPGVRSLIGTLFMLILWECLMLPGIKMLASFDLLCRFYAGILLILSIVSMILCRKELVQSLVFKNLKLLWPSILFLVVFSLQCIYILNVFPDIATDYTVETVNTTLESDLIYENNPYMGSTFQYGITFRGKLVTLPLFYAFLTKVTGLKATVVVYQIIPIWALLLSMLSFIQLGKALFSDKERYPLYFATGIGILNLFGVFSRNCIFFYRMRKGFSGESFLISIFYPLLLYGLMRLGMDKEKKAFFVIGTLLLSSLVVVDYTKGLLMLLYVLFTGCIIISFSHVRRKIHAKRS